MVQAFELWNHHATTVIKGLSRDVLDTNWNSAKRGSKLRIMNVDYSVLAFAKTT